MYLAGVITGTVSSAGIFFLLGFIAISFIAILLILVKNQPKKRDDYALMNDMLQNALTEFGNKIEKSFKDSIDDLGTKLKGMVMEVNLSSQVLDDTVNKFDNSIKVLVENVNKITDFNRNLGENIEKMSESYKRLTDNLNTNTNVIESNFASVGSLARDIKEATEEITSYNKQVIRDMSSIAEEVKGSVEAIKDLGEVLKKDMSMRIEEAKEYQENINQLIEKVSGDISILGYNTANEFAKTIEETAKSTSQKVLQDIISVADEIKGAVVSIKEFSSVMKNDFNLRSEEAKSYQENISKLMDRIQEEMASLGERTATTFSQGLEESAKTVTEKILQDFGEVTTEIENAISVMKSLNEALKTDLDTRILEAREFHDNINRLMLKISGEMSILGQDTAEAFRKTLDESGQSISQKLTENIEEIFKGLYSLLDEFKENEKLLAKTIVMLPDQVITYNETAANKIGMQIDEVKRILRGGL
ncbi:hypothetical protein [Acetivibrio clariflavus]|uniref:Methyl-accepting chemotaxis protein n=1 Tax=Acetivibrio clariflavus (strain DSM 19732 / NBRC 101661 / EBR45) TaxID=720554 RepID=G8LZL0_ACECE|nr:hypothetical protein [Acetivibrio clariflavus]AEV67911.1 hypothetical protein Clocl_1254 [Acetivibrio clariflavus DSM 19732]